jgi:energy-coupling factor transporter ATP-binding protein EcfA2
MIETAQICPYTGLRSFTEEESLYFKGREDDINRATEQLQRNKFLMLTGASGDGKSSLIYAGIIPNARSGFLKSKYSSWCVADFRPERTPFQNLCKAIARQLDINNPGTVEAELNHGFSALVDLYKNSKRYIDTGSNTWQMADERTRGSFRRQAANLIILVDQFEEFFTNPENYKSGVPSKDSNLVLNILLETARIALDEDLPIYVVFTMRSDYIGQCAAFRGLPEYIGFSQFFVPRLNRTQLQQVIEEPATLSGNRISRRLTERLIHDITEGTDQLPILQHALSQIWVAADKGNSEMDLLQYAMVGGMAPGELPDEQLLKFNDWFASIPAEIQEYYQNPNLQNVLDTHTNKLYGEADNYYQDRTGKKISPAHAKLIIRNAFSCLTKIDESRAVRNRMTLEEITNILGLPEFDAVTVGQVLNTFREPGNTFIRPFILEENQESQKIEPGQVLDITHESLIRNWRHLGQWAKEEFDSYSVFIDFSRQLDRWVNSGKSNAFLLSMGPLTYFETWYKKANPNEWWIARYLPGDSTKQKKLEKAKEILENAKEFIAKSARKHLVARTLIHYGPKRIAIAAGIIALITLTSFVASDYFKKQNSNVLKSIGEQTLNIAKIPNVDPGNKAFMICEELKLGTDSIEEIIQAIPDTIQKINVLINVVSQLAVQGKDEPKSEIFKCLSLADSLLESVAIPAAGSTGLSKALGEINNYRIAVEIAYYYNPDPLIAKWRNRNALRSAKWALQIASTQPAGFSDMQNFTVALENAINYHAFTENELKNLIATLSPFDGGLNTEWLKSNFFIDKILLRGVIGYGTKFNGLYQDLAYLYAATGNSEKALQCMDSLLRYSETNYTGDYGAGADNAANIAMVYSANSKTEALDEFVNGYCSRKKIDAEEFYARLLGRTLPGITVLLNLNLFSFGKKRSNLNLVFCSRAQLSFFYNKYREIIRSTLKDEDQKNFYLAISCKNEGVQKSMNREPAGIGEPAVSQLFDQAFAFYKKVTPAFLNQAMTVSGNSGGDEIVAPRKFLFIYPDLRVRFTPLEPRTFFYFYFSDVFLEYIIDHKLFDSLYPGTEELSYISQWTTDYHAENFSLFGFQAQLVRFGVLKKLDENLGARAADQGVDFNLLYLYLGQDAAKSGDSSAMIRYYSKIQLQKLFNIFQANQFAGQIKDQSLRLVAFAVEGLTKYHHPDMAYNLVKMFKNPINRATIYGFVATELQRQNVTGEVINALIDSAKKQVGLADNITDGQPDKCLLAPALILQSPAGNADEAARLIKNIPEKPDAERNMCMSYAFRGDLFLAVKNIPPLISPSDLASFYRNILYGYGIGETKKSKIGWDRYEEYYPPRFNFFIKYIDENS